MTDFAERLIDIEVEGRDPVAPLEVCLVKTGGRLLLQLIHDRELLSARSVELFGNDMTELMVRMMKEPGLRLDDLEPAAELRQRLAVGHRVVAPDLFGFGRSDKPVDDDVYTIGFHRRSLLGLIERLDLRNVALVCQDWGGILGLTLPMEMPERFTRLLVMSTWLPIGKPASEGFAGWMYFVENAPEFPVAALLVFDANGAANPFDAVAYDAPFPDNRYKAGVRRFPRIVPARPGMDGIELIQRARAFWSNDWQGDSFMAVGTRDQVITEDVMEERHAVRHRWSGSSTPPSVDHAGLSRQEHSGLR